MQTLPKLQDLWNLVFKKFEDFENKYFLLRKERYIFCDPICRYTCHTGFFDEDIYRVHAGMMMLMTMMMLLLLTMMMMPVCIIW